MIAWCPRKPVRFALLLSLGAMASGCAEFPELDGSVDPRFENADYPKLIPVAPLLAGAKGGRASPESQQALLARAAALRARAARLRGRVIDSPSMTRMQAGVSGS